MALPLVQGPLVAQQLHDWIQNRVRNMPAERSLTGAPSHATIRATHMQNLPACSLPHCMHEEPTRPTGNNRLMPVWIDGGQGSRTITARSGVSAHLSINAVLRQAALALPQDVVLPRVLREAPVPNANERDYICRRCDIQLLASDSCWSQRRHARFATLEHQRVGNGIKHTCCRRPPFSRCPASPGDVCKKAGIQKAADTHQLRLSTIFWRPGNLNLARRMASCACSTGIAGHVSPLPRELSLLSSGRQSCCMHGPTL